VKPGLFRNMRNPYRKSCARRLMVTSVS
jgi:hypothetical protein